MQKTEYQIRSRNGRIVASYDDAVRAARHIEAMGQIVTLRLIEVVTFEQELNPVDLLTAA